MKSKLFFTLLCLGYSLSLSAMEAVQVNSAEAAKSCDVFSSDGMASQKFEEPIVTFLCAMQYVKFFDQPATALVVRRQRVFHGMNQQRLEALSKLINYYKIGEDLKKDRAQAELLLIDLCHWVLTGSETDTTKEEIEDLKNTFEASRSSHVRLSSKDALGRELCPDKNHVYGIAPEVVKKFEMLQGGSGFREEGQFCLGIDHEESSLIFFKKLIYFLNVMGTADDNPGEQLDHISLLVNFIENYSFDDAVDLNEVMEIALKWDFSCIGHAIYRVKRAQEATEKEADRNFGRTLPLKYFAALAKNKVNAPDLVQLLLERVCTDEFKKDLADPKIKFKVYRAVHDFMLALCEHLEFLELGSLELLKDEPYLERAFRDALVAHFGLSFAKTTCDLSEEFPEKKRIVRAFDKEGCLWVMRENSTACSFSKNGEKIFGAARVLSMPFVGSASSHWEPLSASAQISVFGNNTIFCVVYSKVTTIASDPAWGKITGLAHCFQQGKNLIIASYEDGHYRVFDAQQAQQMGELPLPKNLQRSKIFRLEASSELIAGSCSDGSVQIWDSATFDHIQTMSVPDPISFLAILPNKRVAVGCVGSKLYIYDAQAKSEVVLSAELESDKTTITSVATLRDDYILVGYSSGAVRIWETTTGYSRVLDTAKAQPILISQDAANGALVDIVYNNGTVKRCYVAEYVALKDLLDNWSQFGEFYLRRGNYARAEHFFSLACKKNVNNKKALAWAWVGLGQLKIARALKIGEHHDYLKKPLLEQAVEYLKLAEAQYDYLPAKQQAQICLGNYFVQEKGMEKVFTGLHAEKYFKDAASYVSTDCERPDDFERLRAEAKENLNNLYSSRAKLSDALKTFVKTFEGN